METVFIYPFGGQGKISSNPYIGNMRKALASHFKVLAPTYRWKLPRMLVFLLNSFKAGVYVFNWIEESAAERGGNLGGIMSMLGLWILKWRHAKMVWIFHNIHSHSGETAWTKRFRSFLFKNSSLIIAHSKEAAEYASQYAACPVEFKNHPVEKVAYGDWEGEVKECDLFYWSTILPYKGVVEFLSHPKCKESGKRIVLIGGCKDKELDTRIREAATENVVYENRKANFSEIAAQCRKAKYVVFPYIGDSISSSGVLMDTLLMGGTPVGPNRGAFADLAAEGCCLTYDNIDEVFDLPVGSNQVIHLNQEKVDMFIDENSWDAFGLWMSNIIGKF